MGKFNRDGRGADKGFGRGGGGNNTRYRAVCSECGSSCDLPFKPSPGKPVYCDSCFGKQMANKGGSDRPNKFGSGRPRFSDRQTFTAICEKCGQSCQVPFKPTAGKPVYCDKCFSKGSKFGGGSASGQQSSGGNVAAELKMLNGKLDKIISLLTPTTVPEKSPDKKEKIAVKPVAKKAVAKKVTSKKSAVKKTTTKKATKKK